MRSSVNSRKSQPWNVGITLRTALVSWLVTLVTLLIFVAVIIPQQKQIFLENLASKAHGVAVSVRDVAGAALNDDLSSVAVHCEEVLKGDKALDYLVLKKNDGFLLINQRVTAVKGKDTTWRYEPNGGKTWQPDQRETLSGIGYVAYFHRNVFYYSQPFDYNGIEWGWIHVGLSLDNYNRNVALVYHRTGLLAVLCIVLSLLASGMYAKWLVRPILDLRTVVQKVAAGDLSVRAGIQRGDEWGSLAGSVNSMTEALLRRDKILQSVRFAAQEFLSTSDWKAVIGEVLANIGQAAAVSRIRVFEHQVDASGKSIILPRYKWVAKSSGEAAEGAIDPEFNLDDASFGPWIEVLKRGELISAHAHQLDEKLKKILFSLDLQSILLIPIRVEKNWWGVLTLAECQQQRHWTEAERDSIRAAADMLGAAIARQRTQEALEEAKATLELRVAERTQQLQEQVAAKEKVNAALAEMQQQLIQTSRQAGMAEVATGVLHNVGNVLNSVNVSTTLVCDRMRLSKIASLLKAAQLFREHETDLAAYLTLDARGQRLPSLLINLADHLEKERSGIVEELSLLAKNIEHIKEIVAMQQNYANVSGVIEALSLADVVDDALMMNEAALKRHAIEVIREYQDVPLVLVDKHKVLQVLLNLVRNAKYAMDEKAGNYVRYLKVSLKLQEEDRVQIAVNDNGIGIKPENMTRIFAHGFTTKKDGHGFGLHMGALAAKEMRGSLSVFSDGPGQGATFVLELPLTGAKI